MNQAILRKQFEKTLARATKAIEEHVDNEIDKLEKMNEDDFEKLRQKRLSELKKQAKEKQECLANGHGKYFDVPGERELFDEFKKSKNVVCHFSRDVTMRCQIFDKHLTEIAKKHWECKFIKLNAEKAPFLTRKLNVFVIPTLVIIKDENVSDYIVGFDDLGGNDDFSTRMLEWRLGVAQVITYDGDLNQPPDMENTAGSILKPDKKRTALRTIRGKQNENEDSDDNDWE